MISNYDMDVLKIDLTVISTIILISHLLNSTINNEEVFNNQWIKVSLATVLGYVLHSLLFHKISAMVSTNFNLKNTIAITVIYDIVKFGSIFVSREIILSYITNRSINFGIQWQMESGFTILGYMIFDALNVNMHINKEYDIILNDIIKLSLGQISCNYFINNTITYENVIDMLATSAGVTVYHLITKNLIINSKSIYKGGYSSLPPDYLFMLNN